MKEPLRALLVEDSESDAGLVVRALEQAGFAVRADRVETEADFRAALRRETWEIVLSDFHLPTFGAMGALEVLKAVRPDIPFIAVSGIVGEETAVELLKAGAGDFVSKSALGRLGPAVRREMAEARNRRERAQALKDLERSESRFRQVAENAGDWIWEVDTDGVYTYASPVVGPILGYAPEELVGRVRYYDLFTDEARDELKALAQAAFTVGQAFRHFENPNRHKDGRTVILETSGVPIRDEAGRMIGYRGVDKDVTERRTIAERDRQSLKKLEAAAKAAIAALAATVETRDPYTAGHQSRVMALAVALAREMGLPEDRVEGIGIAGAIHDLGKIAVPAEILSKPSRLTALEFLMIKTHAQVGYDILAKIEFPWPLARMVHEHHERLDGSGYPQGLKGPDILLESKILALADVVESMSSHRPYRPALGIEAALAEVAAHRGRLYDEGAVDACLRLFAEKRFVFD